MKVQENEKIVVNGTGEHVTNGVHKPKSNGVSEQINIEIIKEQQTVNENMQIMIEGKDDVILI